MINPQWLELPLSRINFHGPKDVRAIEVLLYLESYLSYFSTKTNVVCTHEKCLLEALLMSTHNIFLGEIQKYINTFWLEKQKKYLELSGYTTSRVERKTSVSQMVVFPQT